MAFESIFFSLAAFAFVLGAVVGSFLNVVIYRVPAGESIIKPSSRCPECQCPIRWYDNIPIISWFVLNGSCRNCEASISPRYVIIEALMGFFATALWIKVAGPSFADAQWIADIPWVAVGVTFGFYFVFLALLVVITFVDLDHYLIPHEFTLPGIVLGIIAAFVLNKVVPLAFWPPVTITGSLIGLVAGALSIIILFYVYFAARGVEGLGGGDVTMMALMGTWLGWPALIFIFFAASVQGLIAAAIGALVGASFLKDSREILAEDDPRTADESTPKRRSPDDAKSQPSDDDDIPESPGEQSEDDNQETDDGAIDDEAPGGMALPFGPFIALAGIEFLFVGDLLPQWISLRYLYGL